MPRAGRPSFEIPDAPGDRRCRLARARHHALAVRARWLDMNENCVDQAHFKFIHGTLTIPPTTAEIEKGHVHVAESQFRMKVPGGEADADARHARLRPGLPDGARWRA